MLRSGCVGLNASQCCSGLHASAGRIGTFTCSKKEFIFWDPLRFEEEVVSAKMDDLRENIQLEKLRALKPVAVLSEMTPPQRKLGLTSTKMDPKAMAKELQDEVCPCFSYLLLLLLKCCCTSRRRVSPVPSPLSSPRVLFLPRCDDDCTTINRNHARWMSVCAMELPRQVSTATCGSDRQNR